MTSSSVKVVEPTACGKGDRDLDRAAWASAEGDAAGDDGEDLGVVSSSPSSLCNVMGIVSGAGESKMRLGPDARIPVPAGTVEVDPATRLCQPHVPVWLEKENLIP